MKLITKNPSSPQSILSYEGDVLFRMYMSQKPPFETFCFDVYVRNGASSKYCGQGTAEHPQGVQNAMELLLQEQRDRDVVVEISNEMVSTPDFDCHEWFRCALQAIDQGFEKYHKWKSNKESALTVLCPVCGLEMFIKEGRYGSFWGCSNFPKCKGSRSCSDRNDADFDKKALRGLGGDGDDEYDKEMDEVFGYNSGSFGDN